MNGSISPLLLHLPQARLLPPPPRAEYEPHRMLTTATQVRSASEQLRVAPRVSEWDHQRETVRANADAVLAQGERLARLERESRELRGALLRVESMLELLLPKEAPISSSHSAPSNNSCNAKRKYSDAAQQQQQQQDEESTALV